MDKIYLLIKICNAIEVPKTCDMQWLPILVSFYLNGIFCSSDFPLIDYKELNYKLYVYKSFGLTKLFSKKSILVFIYSNAREQYHTF